MKLQPDRTNTLAVTAYSSDWIAINGIRHTRSLLISSSGTVEEWPIKEFNEIKPAHLEMIWATGAEILLLGYAERQQHASYGHLAPVMEKGIGAETMDTAAACRTFNILAAEGRRVAAILMLNQAQS
jgi:uncharacterized protein